MGSRRWNSSLAVCALSLAYFQVAFGQAAADLARSTGSPTTIYHGTDVEHVDTSSGNVRIILPLLHFPGRGLDTDVILSYNSKIWDTIYQPSGDPGVPGIGVITPDITNYLQVSGPATQAPQGGAGWNLGIPRMGVLIPDSGECTSVDPNSGSCLFNIAHSTFLQSDGGRIALVNEPTSTSSDMWTFDGSFALLTNRGLVYKDGVTAVGVWGTPLQPFQEMLTDTNGNQITCLFAESNVSGVPTSCLDTLKRQITFSPNANGLLASVGYIDSSGASRSITFQYTQFVVNYPFSESNAGCNWHGFTPVSIPLLTSVTLANGRSYSFQYANNGDGSTTAEITKITLPTGGYVRYDYTSAPVSTMNHCGFGVGNGQDRVVAHRFVSPDGTAGSEQEWQYFFTNDGVSATTTVVDPLNNSQVYIHPSGSPLATEIDYKDSTGKTLKSEIGQVVSAPGANEYFYDTVNFSNARYAYLKTVLSDTNQQSQTSFTYGAFNNVTEKDETDWGTGAPGTVIRKSTFSYQNDFNSAYAADNVHILDRIRAQTVCDGAGTFCSMSTTSYDTTSIASTSTNPVVNHDYTNYPSTNTFRGNPTVISRVINPTGGNAVTTNTYNDVGNLLTITDPNNNLTTFSYADNFASGSSPQPTSAYVSQITLPQTNGVSHIHRSQYYFNTGLMASTCGENFPSSTTCAATLTGIHSDYQSFTYDVMGRLLSVTQGDSGSIMLTYNETSLPLNVVTRTKVDTNSADDVLEQSTYDGLGRVSQNQITSDPGGITYQATIYDALGRPSKVYNPTRCNPPSTNCGEATWGYITFSYDGLGRVFQTTSQDGGLAKAKFVGNTTLVVDQAGKQRQTITDGLGRVTEVDEPGTQPPSQPNYATMQTDGNFVLYNSSNSALWSSGTSGSTASSIMMQDDGNLVLYIFKWFAGVYAAPSPGPFPPATCSIGSYIVAGETIPSGKCIASPHGQYFLYMSPDGNFYIYNYAQGSASWGANVTIGHPGAYAQLLTNGNFVVNDVNGVTLWSSGTAGTNSERLDLEDDGRMILYKSAWNSGTSTGQFNWTQLAHPGCDVGTGTGWTGVLGAGQCFVSPNGHFQLLLQTSGDLVINDLSVTPPNALWSTNVGITPISPGYAFVTKYTYDGLSNLTCLEQHGSDTGGTGCGAPAASDANSTWRVRRFAYDTLSRLVSSSSPESNTANTSAPYVRVNTTYTYDANGNLLQKTSPAPNQTGTATQTISYCYDALNRVTGKKYAPSTCPLTSPVATYFFDQTTFNSLNTTNGIGRRTGMNDQAGAEAWSYDPVGRTAADSRTIGSVNKSTSYLYNFTGDPTSITYPSGRTISYAYDTAGRTVSAADAPNSISYASLATYSPLGALSSLKNGTNLTASFYSNQRLQPCRISVTTGTSHPANCGDLNAIGNIMDFVYGFNLSAGDNGNVSLITNNRDPDRTQTFAYDGLNRILSAQTQATTGPKCFGETFAYDAWGNLTTIGGLSPYSGCTQEHPAWGAINLKNQIGINLYDTAGNMTTGGYTYDSENHLLTAGGVTYTYDGDGKRVQKSSGKLYWYSADGDVLNETDASGSTTSSGFNEYIFFNNKRIARRDSTNSIFYYFADYLGTSRTIVQDGQTSDCYDADFYPFGGERTPIVNTCPQNYKYAGMELDSETSLNHTEFRQFESAQGRWLSPDPSSGSINLANPQSFNRYTYVLNNPLTMSDPRGLDCIYDADAAKGAGLPGPGIIRGDCLSDTDGGVFVAGTVFQAIWDPGKDVYTFRWRDFGDLVNGEGGSENMPASQFAGAVDPMDWMNEYFRTEKQKREKAAHSDVPLNPIALTIFTQVGIETGGLTKQVNCTAAAIYPFLPGPKPEDVDSLLTDQALEGASKGLERKSEQMKAVAEKLKRAKKKGTAQAARVAGDESEMIKDAGKAVEFINLVVSANDAYDNYQECEAEP